ncbi:unnamed protein product [Lactuca virosa]|uniref:Cytochrome P450 n=1 Tax=Lactuca virosa TaxID=75947 RepID=A0AAU9MJM1_9ASTR|nr:unnamed protein product [Lactuca virosa]
MEMIIDDHQNHTTGEVTDDHDKDFIHTLIELSSIENPSDDRLTKGDIKALVMDILTGGTDTTVVTIVWAIVLPGTCVLVNGWWVGRDPGTWGENAAEFYPERFENLDVDFGGGNFEMVPFGGGRRSCPAMKTVPATLEAIIANLLYWFDWEVPDGVKNEDMKM